MTNDGSTKIGPDAASQLARLSVTGPGGRSGHRHRRIGSRLTRAGAGLSRAVPIAALLGVLALPALLAACSDPSVAENSGTRLAVTGIRYLGDPVAGDFERAEAPRPFEFPRDHGAHRGFRTEWWYFTGNLFDENERHFGFELTFFRVGLKPDEPVRGTAPDAASQPASEVQSLSPSQRAALVSAWTTDSVWLAHFALTDTEAGEFYAAERLSRGHQRLAYADVEPLALRVEDWHAEQDGTRSLKLHAATNRAAIDLTLAGLDRIVLQGDRGYDAKGPEPGNASYYYSVPRMLVDGAVRDTNGETHDVTGTAWLDREWATSALSADIEGWDWFALQLSDGRDLMYYRLRGTDGSTSPFSNGSITEASGESRPLPAGAVELEPIEHWRSDRTGVRYPVAWHVAIPGEQLELEVTPYLRNQELDLSVRYWEGAIQVRGEAADEPISGQGYLELAGY